MGLPAELRRSSIRISLGPWISADDLDGIVDRFHAGLEDVSSS